MSIRPLPEVFTELKAFWEADKAAAIRIATPATEAQIREWEERRDVRLSNDLRDYFAILNGMSNHGEVYEIDSNIMHFFELADFKSLREHHSSERESWSHSTFVIAEYSVWAGSWGVRLDQAASDPAVYEISGSVPRRVSGSFREFLETYLRDGLAEILI